MPFFATIFKIITANSILQQWQRDTVSRCERSESPPAGSHIFYDSMDYCAVSRSRPSGSTKKDALNTKQSAIAFVKSVTDAWDNVPGLHHIIYTFPDVMRRLKNRQWKIYKR
jgi:hypothetical protein